LIHLQNVEVKIAEGKKKVDGQNVERKNAEWDETSDVKKHRLGQEVEKKTSTRTKRQKVKKTYLDCWE
jgi:hypothetical protein